MASSFKLVWVWPIAQRATLTTTPDKGIVRFSVEGGKPTAVVAPISGTVSAIRVTSKRNALSEVEITSTLPDGTIITNRLRDIAGVTVKENETVLRGQPLGTTAKAFVSFVSSNLDWSSTVVFAGSKGGLPLAIDPLGLVDATGQIQDPETGTLPEFLLPPSRLPPSRRIGIGIGAGAGSLLLVGGVAWLLLRDKKKKEDV